MTTVEHNLLLILLLDIAGVDSWNPGRVNQTIVDISDKDTVLAHNKDVDR